MPRNTAAVVLLFVVGVSNLYAQIPGFPQLQGQPIDGDTALNLALKTSSLTDEGKPFHAVLKIGDPGSTYSGQVEVWWAGEQKYKTVIASPAFSQTRIVNGAQVMEANVGDYYPRWLENFVLAILNPIPVAANFRGRRSAVMVGPQIVSSCLRRDDRPGGITDQMTWGIVCFRGSEPRIESVLTTNISLTFDDWKSFNKKKVARTYKTSVLGFEEVVAHLTTLEDLRNVPDETFAVTAPTPPDQQITTTYVSTQKEESLIENAPKIDWPPVREGKTEGYMIVYARTDRTGQVRETAKHNSDQPGLEDFGMQQALRYKFKPLVVNGVAVQMEMPLVLHFTARSADPLPVLHGEDLLKQISGCDAKLVSAIPTSGVTPTHISVNEEGKLTGEGFGTTADPGLPAVLITVHRAMGLECHFAPLIRNGVVTYYHGELLVAH
ncbi:MAG TPA: hypothetical protein VK819_01870 [Acidobacteriaceae bacterium]|jgi:hypothetical protein|nr:hypothetical protein [Acidobacteriaceae bacterium]